LFKTHTWILGFLGLIQATTLYGQPFRVVIDPGHGGPDEGTVFVHGATRLTEKEVTLQLAQRVAQQLLAQGIQVTLTRTTDQEVTLPRRTALANQLGADVFISIHMNSTHDSSLTEAEGVETYILNSTSDALSKRLARLENSVISQPTESPEQMDVALILKDLRLDANLSESKRLACSIQKSLVAATSKRPLFTKRNRGVKQALFHVLLGADMPSILVEAGFLSSPRDRALVTSPEGQTKMSQAIAQAVAEFQHRKNMKSRFAFNRCKVN